MRKLPVFALITSWATIGVISFAVARQRRRQYLSHRQKAQTKISGEITDIIGINLKIKDETVKYTLLRLLSQNFC